MKRQIKLISLGALMAVAMASASAQTPTPATGASAPATVGVTPQEAATANRQAVPRSDTATVVRTAPSPMQRASGAMNDTTTAPAATNDGTGSSGAMNGNTRSGMTRSSAMGTNRPARADRN